MPNHVTYKLPAPILDSYRALLDGVDWQAGQRIPLDTAEDHKPELEAVLRNGRLVVRPVSVKCAIVLRRFADKIARANPDRYPPQSAAQTALVLAARNPKDEGSDEPT